MTITTLIAGLLIFAIGFALGFFVCILGLIAEKARADEDKVKKNDGKTVDKKQGGSQS